MNARLATLKACAAQNRQHRHTVEELRAKVADLPAVWSAATPQQRNTMLQIVIQRAVVTASDRHIGGPGSGKQVEIQRADWLT